MAQPERHKLKVGERRACLQIHTLPHPPPLPPHGVEVPPPLISWSSDTWLDHVKYYAGDGCGECVSPYPLIQSARSTRRQLDLMTWLKPHMLQKYYDYQTEVVSGFCSNRAATFCSPSRIQYMIPRMMFKYLLIVKLKDIGPYCIFNEWAWNQALESWFLTVERLKGSFVLAARGSDGIVLHTNGQVTSCLFSL